MATSAPSPQKLSAEALIRFQCFWNAYSLKRGLEDAKRSWSQIESQHLDEFEDIVRCANLDANRRGEIVLNGRERQTASAWLKHRRWRDPLYSAASPQAAIDNKLISADRVAHGADC